MTENSRSPIWGKNILFVTAFFGILTSWLPALQLQILEVKAEAPESTETLTMVQGNSLLPLAEPCKRVLRRMEVVVTAYSSTPWETDDTPHITASGSWVRDGIVANNYLPFGTKIRFPEIYPDEIFVVEDRMNSVKEGYHVDIWFPSTTEAKEFGAKRTYIEILGM